MVKKYSITIRGHRTSFSIEPEFHAELLRLARHQNRSLASLVTRIDSRRPSGQNLSSAIRIAVLHALRGSADPASSRG